jgi:hypothetical protein
MTSANPYPQIAVRLPRQLQSQAKATVETTSGKSAIMPMVK